MKALAVVLSFLALGIGPAPRDAHGASLELAWRQHGNTVFRELDSDGRLTATPNPTNTETSLGSLWKLFVYAYLVDRGLSEAPYQCRGRNPEEVYCCPSGGRIERDDALVHSCGLYFDPRRLGISASDWAGYWAAHTGDDWLSDLNRLGPQQRVPVANLLRSLETLPAQNQAREVLLDVVLHAQDSALVGSLGGRLRVKTWSWHDPVAPGHRQGGFAGWLSDGTPVWARGPGTSQSVLKTYGAALGKAIPTLGHRDDKVCVDVALFQRYPVKDVLTTEGKSATVGTLNGSFVVDFEKGTRLSITSQHDLVFSRTPAPTLIARLSRDDYVARVLDREASSQPEEAAKALSVVIRSYLEQNAEHDGPCLYISDSSATQRVAPRPASAAARRIADFTADLVLSGAPVRYHRDEAGDHRLAWSDAVALANQGLRFDAILGRSLPAASLSRWGHPDIGCQTLVTAKTWLLGRLPLFRERLEQEPGYTETHQFAVCQLASGRPHIDREKHRIFVRGLRSQQDRLDLVHEYLHLAFDGFPSSQDETYVEALTRRLLLE